MRGRSLVSLLDSVKYKPYKDRDDKGCFPFTRKNRLVTVVVIGTRQIPNGNFHGDTLVQFPRLFSGSKEIIREPGTSKN